MIYLFSWYVLINTVYTVWAVYRDVHNLKNMSDHKTISADRDRFFEEANFWMGESRKANK